MAARHVLAAALVAVSATFGASAAAAPVPLSGGADPDRTLRMLRSNPRYFADRSGKAVLLVGSHVWWNLVGDTTWLPCDQPARPFDYGAYLDKLAFHGHNFIRLWRIEQTRWDDCVGTVSVAPHPWLRTGPGEALDGLPRFDLSRFDETYFQRLRERVATAGARGIYVSVMLFEGVHLQTGQPPWNWAGHPFNAANNVNGIEGDANGDGVGTEIQTQPSPAVLAVQDAYVRKVVDTLNDLDNVLYEVANESTPDSTAWQEHVIRVVRSYEATKPKRHPIGMTFQHGGKTNALLEASSADWISPGGPQYLWDPPPTNGRKIVVSDTDHHCGVCGDETFPWRSFLRGYNPIYMDPMDDEPVHHGVRSALGQVRRYATRIDLAASRPRPRLSSTRYALVVPGRQYLVYQPAAGRFRVDLRGTRRRFSIEWFDPITDRARRGRRVAGGRVRAFTPPFAGRAVLLLRALPRR